MDRKRNVYLNMKTLDQARELWLARFDFAALVGKQQLGVEDAVGRVLAEPAFARLSSPSYHGAAMDGFALRAERTYGASEARPVALAVGEQAIAVNTGDRLPEGTDAVVMIEHARQRDESTIELEAAVYPWQHVRKVGEDIVATEMLFARHHRVTPYCVGALLAGGVLSVAVKARPRVLIVPTGSEMVQPTEASLSALEPGQIIESNSAVLGQLVEAAGGSYDRHESVADDPDAIVDVIDRGTEQDYAMVLIIGGSSAGAGDYSRAAIARAGEVLVHGVTIMPGKPTVLGAVRDKPVVGVPGYPVSAIVCFEQLVAPALGAMLGQPPQPRPTVQVQPTRKIASKLGLEEFVRVRLGQVDERIVATALPRGAGTVTSLTRADGILRIGADLEGLRPTEPVAAELLRPLSQVEQNIVAVGSHDNCLDLLGDLLRKQHGTVTLASSHVGSLGGIMTIKRNACHVAGSHLLDPADGSYNVSTIRQHLPDVPVKLVHLVHRQQGLMVRPGNPKGISSVADLAQASVRMVNRQAGSGTRVLLDYELSKQGIAPADIRGYETEEYTHMAVAVAVLSGAADAGLGILAAARALELGFVPVVEEQYDLIIPERFFDTERIQKLLATIRSTEFRDAALALGGYRLDGAGELLEI